MVATPVMAAPINPAASLSLDTAPRASTHVKHSNDLIGGALIIALIAGAGAIAAVVVVATNNSTSP
jgi:hypothetical protein